MVVTNPESSVYINGVFAGKTPFKGTYKAGEIIVKLVPQTTTETDLLPFETKIKLVSGIQTVVRREFGKTEQESSGDIISFEKENGDGSLIVVSTPDNAQISIDGTPRGFAPYKSSSISPAEHQITVKAPGYNDRVMTVKTIAGFKLTVFAKLSKMPEEPKPETKATTKTYVEILSTPTGYLRVRTEPGTGGSEIDQVKPGDTYLLLEEATESGWFKIQLEAPVAGLPEGRSGWITGQYAKKVEISQ